MTLAAVLPRFARAGFLQSRNAHPQQPATVGRVREQQHAMSHNAILTLKNAPLRLHVLRGCVWVTRDGSPADIVLGVGEVFEQRPGARVLVQALEASEVLIAEAEAGSQNA